MNKVGISAPWINFYNEINELFKYDKDIKIVWNNDARDLKLFVDDPVKAAALTKLLPVEKEFGNIKMTITVIPADTEVKNYFISAIAAAFNGNPIFDKTVASQEGLFQFNYAVFKNRVVQYFNDNLMDVNGNTSTLYENIARDVFGEEAGTYFCTSNEQPVYIK